MCYSIVLSCRNVVDRGLVDTLILPDSDAYDTVTCALVTDIDFDGIQEIILGTYGQVCIADTEYLKICRQFNIYSKHISF